MAQMACPPVPANAAHAAAMDVHSNLSRTQFGRAAIERHGHTPMPIEQAEAYQKQIASRTGPANG